MKLRYMILLVLLILPAFHSPALEAGLELSGGNLNFNPNRAPTETDYDPYYLPVGYAVYGSQKFDETIDVDFGFRSDRILKNMLYGTFSYSGNFFSLEVGPYFGLLNSDEVTVKPGVIAAVTFQAPGKAFLSLRSARSLNILNIFTGNEISGVVSSTGDYLQEDNEIKVGFYAQNTIISFLVHSKIYTEKNDSFGVVSDSQTDYSFITDIFQKNAPFRLGISFTYRNLTRIYEDSEPSMKHSIGSLVLGTGFDYYINSDVMILAKLESSVFSFGLDDLIGEFGSTTYFFSLVTGVKINLDPYLKK